mgnify:FL=1
MATGVGEVLKLFIGGLTIETTEAQIEEHFSKFGFVFDILIIRNRDSNVSKGYGFISCNNIKTYQRIIASEHTINGRIIDCHASFKKSDDPQKFKENANKKIFVGGISLETTDQDLSNYFSTFGAVRQCYVIKDPVTKRSKKFGFAIMRDLDAVEAVLAVQTHCIRGVNASCKLFVRFDEETPLVSNNTEQINSTDVKNNYASLNHEQITEERAIKYQQRAIPTNGGSMSHKHHQGLSYTAYNDDPTYNQKPFIAANSSLNTKTNNKYSNFDKACNSSKFRNCSRVLPKTKRPVAYPEYDHEEPDSLLANYDDASILSPLPPLHAVPTEDYHLNVYTDKNLLSVQPIEVLWPAQSLEELNSGIDARKGRGKKPYPTVCVLRTPWGAAVRLSAEFDKFTEYNKKLTLAESDYALHHCLNKMKIQGHSEMDNGIRINLSMSPTRCKGLWTRYCNITSI